MPSLDLGEERHVQKGAGGESWRGRCPRFRAAYEIGARTVAIFPHEDPWSEHRLKTDEAYQIGELGHPVKAYLDPDEIVRVALECGADAFYPGYGFLSENSALAEACADAGKSRFSERSGSRL